MATEAMVVSSEERGLVRQEAGVMALSMMNEGEFKARLEAMKRGQERVRMIQRELMVGPTKEDPEGEDYGVIPGTKKPTLFKPGAEKLCNVYNLVPTFEETWIEGDGVTSPHLRVRIKCRLHRGDANGPVVGEGLGAANSWERKHRWRQGGRSCPACGVEGTINRSKNADDNGDRGWYCWAKKGGCGAQFASTATAIVSQDAGEIENKDPFDVENTILKMAKKRAHVDGVLSATATSGLFSQDLEDMAPPSRRPAEREPGNDDGPDEPRPQREPLITPPRSRQQMAAEFGPKPAPLAPADCPHCGKTAQPSKFPKEGKTHYCYGCKHPFAPEADGQ